jgi:hypothetical protein
MAIREEGKNEGGRKLKIGEERERADTQIFSSWYLFSWRSYGPPPCPYGQFVTPDDC